MDRTRRGFIATLGTAVAAGCTAPVSQGIAESDGERRYESLYDAVAPSVARIRMYRNGPVGEGSAFRYDEDHLVTNDHVVGRSETVRVQYADGDWHEVEIAGRDPYSDLAVLSTAAEPPGEALDLVDGTPEIGTEVMVVGAPLGLEGSASRGIVSGVNRTIPAPNNFTIADAVQTDAALNPGNSGGPIVNLDGDVVAVATAGGGENLGFGVSSKLASRVVPELVDDGEYEHSYMGVRVLEVSPLVAEANDLPDVRGVYIVGILDGGPADGVFREADDEESVEGATVPVGGDVVVEMADAPIRTHSDLSRFLALETSPGDSIDVTVWREGAEETVELTLGSRPDPTE